MEKKCFPRLRVVRIVQECIDQTGSEPFWVGKPADNSHCRGLRLLHSFYPWSLLFWEMACFGNTPTQCPSVRLLVLCSTISREHLEMPLKGAGKDSFLYCKSPSLTLTQLWKADRGLWWIQLKNHTSEAASTSTASSNGAAQRQDWGDLSDTWNYHFFLPSVILM